MNSGFIIYSVLSVVIFALLLVAVYHHNPSSTSPSWTTTIPSEHLVANVPFHRQINEWSCGAASMQMALHHSGPNVDQRAIIDVMRTNSDLGTLSFDMVRAGHFSARSSSHYSGPFPDQSPQSGWSPQRSLGFATFSRRGDSCWVNDLKRTLARNVPIVILMFYDDALEVDDTHYRLAVGFTDTTVKLLDPWDRPNDDGTMQPRVVEYTDEDFCRLWSYAERNGDLVYPPFFGAYLERISVNVGYAVNSTGNLTITAEITLPCDPNQYSTGIDGLTARLILPVGLTAPKNENTTITFWDRQSWCAGPILTQWVVDPLLEDELETARSIQVFVSGTVRNVVPDITLSNGTVVLGYYYADHIGAIGTIPY